MFEEDYQKMIENAEKSVKNEQKLHKNVKTFTELVASVPTLCPIKNVTPTSVYEVCIHDFPKEYCALCKNEVIKSLESDKERLLKEVDRLKSGAFTPEELQNLCHNMTCGQCKDFLKGCRDYQVGLFGLERVRKVLRELYVEWSRENACKECGVLPDPEGYREHGRSCSRYGAIDRIDVVEP